jgi:hypothetical protein
MTDSQKIEKLIEAVKTILPLAILTRNRRDHDGDVNLVVDHDNRIAFAKNILIDVAE